MYIETVEDYIKKVKRERNFNLVMIGLNVGLATMHTAEAIQRTNSGWQLAAAACWTLAAVFQTAAACKHNNQLKLWREVKAKIEHDAPQDEINDALNKATDPDIVFEQPKKSRFKP